MRFIVLGLAAALSVSGCRTHTVDTCLPDCTAEDQTFFADCVASGIEDPMTMGCEAGNRRCCALAAGCLGALDDQVVVTTQTMCGATLMEDQCWPPCDSVDEQDYAACLSDGNTVCSPEDEACCAGAANCLGTLADWEISADGCCADQRDCALGEACDPMMWTCIRLTAFCGDGVMGTNEECDDHNDVTETCAYGEMSCQVCAAGCVLQAGATSFCGDSVIDALAGESCDPPTRVCDATCHAILPAHCANMTTDGDETDTDCGGSCLPCFPDQRCRLSSDCTILPETAVCGATAFCDVATGLGTCFTRDACVGTDPCMTYFCQFGVGCEQAPLDADLDGDGPSLVECGGDCDDFDPRRSSLLPEVCGDTIDNNCDGAINEGC